MVSMCMCDTCTLNWYFTRFLSPGKNILNGKPKSVLDVVCNIQGHIWTDLLCVQLCSHIKDVYKPCKPL